MILIADGGSTKTHWALITKDLCIKEFYSEGYNPYFVTSEYIIDSLTQVLPADLAHDRIREIYFYGAGVHNEEKGDILASAFKFIFKNAETYIANDLLASCRALLGNKAGFAAILGTGTNTCYFDGEQISFQINSGAYILGDEGSGCHMGKKLLTDYLRGQLPAELKTAFDDKYKMSPSDILENVYSKALANRFCASFTEFLGTHMQTEYAQGIVNASFQQFFSQLVSHYQNYQQYKFNSVGSIGFHFREILTSCAESFGMQVGKIIKSPMQDLLLYHKGILLSKSTALQRQSI